MAHVRVPDENRAIDDPRKIAEFLVRFGIRYEKWDVEGRVAGDATDEQILEAYGNEIERLKRRDGFVTADVINVTSETSGLDEMLAKFDKEHTHTDDEVRFIVKGRGIFHIHPETGPVFSIETGAGELINVPAGTRHWFHLCDEREICAIRLFKDPAGWTPHYVENGAHGRYTPVCWGPSYLPPGTPKIDPVV